MMMKLVLTSTVVAAQLVGCDFKCDYEKEMCLGMRCAPEDITCQMECKSDFLQCDEICKAQVNRCSTSKNNCKNGCNPLKGEFHTTCNNLCEVTFECCVLPSELPSGEGEEYVAMLETTEAASKADIADANKAFTVAAMGSSFFNNFNVNICDDTCGNRWKLCRDGCSFDLRTPDRCVANCDAERRDCDVACISKGNTCGLMRAVCSKSCPERGPHAERCDNMCNAAYECCQMSPFAMKKVASGSSSVHQQVKAPTESEAAAAPGTPQEASDFAVAENKPAKSKTQKTKQQTTPKEKPAKADKQQQQQQPQPPVTEMIM